MTELSNCLKNDIDKIINAKRILYDDLLKLLNNEKYSILQNNQLNDEQHNKEKKLKELLEFKINESNELIPDKNELIIPPDSNNESNNSF
jgi:hypothetical protein